ANVPIVFCESRSLAEEWTYRYLAAASAWRADDEAALDRIAATEEDPTDGPASDSQVESGAAREPTTKVMRRWAEEHGLPVSDRGRLRPDVVRAWHEAHLVVLTIDARERLGCGGWHAPETPSRVVAQRRGSGSVVPARSCTC
ncbi:MAG: Lsr2 family DNA-binding protein, partial [Janthinobacterium lividum]